MSKLLWFVGGIFIGEFFAGWLMHIIYICIIAFLLFSGHFPCGHA